MTSNQIVKVAIVGAGGRSGKFMVEELLRTGKHVVTAITRSDNTAVLPKEVHVKTVDYSNPASLVSALQGQDALVITMNVMAPPDTQTKLIDAAAAANVKWILPNEFGGDPLDVEQGKDGMVGASKVQYRDRIEELGKSSWIGVACGFWYEFSLGGGPNRYGFDFKERALTLFDDGKTRINTSTWPQTGRAVAALLSLKIEPEKEGDVSLVTHFRNKPAYVSSFTLSQVDMLESVSRVEGKIKEDWKITSVPVREIWKSGVDEYKNGNALGFVKLLYSRAFFPESRGNFGGEKGLHNDILGLPQENLDEFTKLAIEMSEKGAT